jgi:hypothetical protein
VAAAFSCRFNRAAASFDENQRFVAAFVERLLEQVSLFRLLSPNVLPHDFLCLFCSVHLVDEGSSTYARVFNVKGLLEQVHLPAVIIAEYFFHKVSVSFC